MAGLLYADKIPINDKICVCVPTVGEILDNDEDVYYGLVSLITSMPADLIAQLDEAGIDFTTISEWELFLMMFGGLSSTNTKMLFGDLDLTKFSIAKNEQNGETVLVDRERDIVIDRAIHARIANTVRKIHHLEKNNKRPANDDAKRYMIERAKAKAKRNRRKQARSQLEPLIVALVNTKEFKYDYQGVRSLTIYQFNESVMQVMKRVSYDNQMFGVYSGTIDVKTLTQEDLNWLVHK